MDPVLKNKEEDNQQDNLYKYACLIVNIPKLGVKTFSYGIPDEFRQTISIGQAVLVSFGSKGIVNAFVVGFSNYIPEGIKVKPILEIIDEKPLFTLEYLNFLQWAGNYYGCPLQTVIETAIPMKFLKQSKNIVKLIPDNTKEYNFTQIQETIINYLSNGSISLNLLQKKTKIPFGRFYNEIRKLKKLEIIETKTEVTDTEQKEQCTKIIKFINSVTENKRYKEILAELEKLGEYDLISFKKLVKTTDKTIKTLLSEGFIEIEERSVFRNPLEIYKERKTEEFFELSEAQKKVYGFIKKKFECNTSEPILLHGITASGKTEIYFHLIRDVLKKDKNVLFLVPEIALASEITRRLAKRFGVENTAIWHSSISEGERYDIWQRLRENKIRILAGARSAVFAPLNNIGLIIIDEEHENSFKQTTPAPRYNAKTVAEKLAKLTNAKILTGSATPDICAYYRAKNTNNLVKLAERYNNAKMAKVIAIDMRAEKMNGGNLLFSRTLTNAINKNLEEKKQSIILINRRGYATTTQCEECGEIITCPKCDIPLVFHKDVNKLKCHYCNYEQLPLIQCPKCGSQNIYSSGIGIEKVEKAALKLFPEATIARLDSDVLNRKNLCSNILQSFSKGEIDILIGTQMIAKGIDNPNVTIVGVINADSGFSFPDFRCAERGFQLLTQVAGRAGRGEIEGKVYFQTFNPDFYVLNNAKNQDYTSFYQTEIEARETFDYPPFSQIVMLYLNSREEWRAKISSQQIAEKLREYFIKKELTEYINILGPSPCVFERIKEQYRYQIMIKNKLGEKGHSLIMKLVSGIILPDNIKLIVDVEPLDIL